MRQTEIKLSISLDKDNVPAHIMWDATDKPEDAKSGTKAFALSIWEAENNNTLRIDLWTEQMMMGEMRRFFLQSVAGLAQTLLNATGDEATFNDTKDLCERLAQRFLKEEKEGKV